MQNAICSTLPSWKPSGHLGCAESQSPGLGQFCQKQDCAGRDGPALGLILPEEAPAWGQNGVPAGGMGGQGPALSSQSCPASPELLPGHTARHLGTALSLAHCVCVSGWRVDGP